MATVGEQIWASLIASWKKRLNLESAGVFVNLTFSFGRFNKYSTPFVPLREFRLLEYRWLVHTKVSPVVKLTIKLKKGIDLSSDEYTFPITWGYRWTGFNSPYTCIFPYKKLGVFFYLSGSGTAGSGSSRKVFLAFFHEFDRDRPGGSRVLPGGQIVVTPRRILDGIRSGALLPRGLIAPARAVPIVRGPHRRKLGTPRPNPEIKSRPNTAALEIYPTTPYNTWVESLETFRRTWTGTTTPNFGRKTKSQLPVNPHTVAIVMTDYSQGYDLRRKIANPATTYNNGWSATYYPMASPVMSLTESQFTQVGNAALNKLAVKAKIALSGNVALNILQARQLSNLLGDTARRITRSIKYLKRGRLAAAAKVLTDGKASVTKFGPPLSIKNTLAKNWLALQYGWKPLLHDVEGAMESYANYIAKNSSYTTVKASKRLVRENRIDILGPVAVYPRIGCEYNHSKWQCRYGVRFVISDPLKSFYAQTGFTTPLNLAWEVIPFSFVFDWFMPIGPYLEAMSQPHGIKVQSGYKTLFGLRETTTDVHWHGTMPGDPSAELRTYTHRKRKSIAMERTALTSWPAPRFPTFKNPVSTVHALNALALLQALRPKR